MGVVDRRARPRMEERRTMVRSHDPACEDRTGCDHPGQGRRGEARSPPRSSEPPETDDASRKPDADPGTGRRGQINKLFRRMSYVEENEATSHITLVHFYGDHAMSPAGLPSDMDKPVVGGEQTELPVLLDEERIQHTDISAAGRPAEVDAIPSELEANAMSEPVQVFTWSSFPLSYLLEPLLQSWTRRSLPSLWYVYSPPRASDCFPFCDDGR